MAALRLRIVRCIERTHCGRAVRRRSRLRYPEAVLTVISWYQARRSRRQLHELVEAALTDKPTLVAIVSDRYTPDAPVRPFAPVAGRSGDRLHGILAAEWEQDDRERDGEQVL